MNEIIPPRAASYAEMFLVLPRTLNLSEFVDGRGWSIYGSVRLNEAPRFARDWLENREEIHSS